MKNKALNFFHQYLIYSTPLAFAVMSDGHLWPSFLPISVIGDNWVSTIMGALFLLWLASLIVYLARLSWSEYYRTAFFEKLAGIQERDEREELMVGQAAKASFLFVLSILLVLFFASTWRYGTVTEGSESSWSFTIGHLDLVEKPLDIVDKSQAIYNALPISKTTLLLFIISLQLMSFRYFSRKPAKNK